MSRQVGETMENLQRSQSIDDIQESWISGHLYYHQSLDQVVHGFVHPLVASLVKDGRIRAFFFVRDSLGGPHIRLRLRVIPGAREHALQVMEQTAQGFLDLSPSTKSMDEEVIRRSNEYILATDPHEIDDSVYPDNSFRVTPFRPEIERYGGPRLFRLSLDFFTLSSVAAVEFLTKYGEGPRSAQLAQAFCLLLKQAIGFAADYIELSDLLRYGVDSWGRSLPKVIEKGDKVALSQEAVFLQLFYKSLAEAADSLRSQSESLASDFLVMGASRLSTSIGTADRVTRVRIGGSQLHMTATRLGLSNAEEVYISRLLSLTLRNARTTSREKFLWLVNKAEEFSEPLAPEDALCRLISSALAGLDRWRPQN